MSFRTFQRYIDRGGSPQIQENPEHHYDGDAYNRDSIVEVLCGSTSLLLNAFSWMSTPAILQDTWHKTYLSEEPLTGLQEEYLEFLLTLDR